MRRDRPRRVGVNMMSVSTAANARKAGVGRYALAIVEALGRIAPEVMFEVWVRPGFEPPPGWAGLGNLKIRRVGFYKLVEFAAGPWSVGRGYVAWFAPSYDLLRACPIRQVPMIHDVFPITHPEWFPEDGAASIARSVLAAARVGRPVLVNSESTARAVRDRLGVPASRVVVSPLGPGQEADPVEPSSVSDEKLRDLGVPFRRFFLSVGTLEPRKNLPRLLEAFAATTGDAGLVLVGGEGWKYGQALERLAAPDLAGRVARVGYLADDDLAALYARCLAFVCPSLAEGFGLPVLEALRAGAPVLSSDAGALPEVGGDVARYFDPLDVPGLTSLLEAASSDPGLRARTRDAARARAAGFTWREAARRTLGAILG